MPCSEDSTILRIMHSLCERLVRLNSGMRSKKGTSDKCKRRSYSSHHLEACFVNLALSISKYLLQGRFEHLSAS